MTPVRQNQKMARSVYLGIRAENQADAEVVIRDLMEVFGKRIVMSLHEAADGTWLAHAIIVKASNDEPWCIAYREDGSLCRRLATVMDEKRGGMVCEERAE